MRDKSENVNLIASTLTNPMGTTVIGHVNDQAAAIRLLTSKHDVVELKADASGDFVYRYEAPVMDEYVTVQACLHDEVVETVDAAVEMPAPVVTGVISTRDGQRYLEGRVNQPNTAVKMQVQGETIDVVVDDNYEFEMLVPEHTQIEAIELTCFNEKTQKQGHSQVSLGVTSKTQAMPILTDAMIEDYQAKQVGKAHPTQSSTVEKDVAGEQQAATKPEQIVRDSVAQKENDPMPTPSRSANGKKSGFFSKLFGKLF